MQSSERGDTYAHAAALAYEIHSVFGMGSGWAWDSDTLVTNWHVVRHMTAGLPMWVEQYDTTWVIVDIEQLPGIDGALVHVAGPPLTVAQRGPDPAVGDWLLMVGSPRNSMEPIVTRGVGCGRFSHNEWAVDGAVIPGMSGGPVVNDQGQVVGMNVATTIPPGRSLGLIIPLSEILDALERFAREREAGTPDSGGGQGASGTG